MQLVGTPTRSSYEGLSNRVMVVQSDLQYACEWGWNGLAARCPFALFLQHLMVAGNAGGLHACLALHADQHSCFNACALTCLLLSLCSADADADALPFLQPLWLAATSHTLSP
jgi:hypothetical protein